MNRYNTIAIVCAAAGTLALAACDRNDSRTTGQKLDDAVQTAQQKGDAAIEGAASRLESAAGNVADKVDDAGITASINAELAKDPSLSAMKIDVDTSNGHVLLRGTAPDKAARDRATMLAANVKGVTSVENRLEVHG